MHDTKVNIRTNEKLTFQMSFFTIFLKSNAMNTNYFITFLQTADVALIIFK